jgi:hypothetical protein
MAFSSLQKVKIRLYLGYPNLFRYKHTRLESAMDAVDPDAETLVAADLVILDTIYTQLSGVVVSNSGIKKVDEVEFFGGSEERDGVRSSGRQVISRISTILGVPIYADVFGEMGYPGDAWSDLGGLGGATRGGGVIPLG